MLLDLITMHRAFPILCLSIALASPCSAGGEIPRATLARDTVGCWPEGLADAISRAEQAAATAEARDLTQVGLGGGRCAYLFDGQEVWVMEEDGDLACLARLALPALCFWTRREVVAGSGP